MAVAMHCVLVAATVAVIRSAAVGPAVAVIVAAVVAALAANSAAPKPGVPVSLSVFLKMDGCHSSISVGGKTV